jgi:hypothetical protein
MWHPDDVDDVFSDIRLAFGHRYARHLSEAAGQVLPVSDDFVRLGAAWVQQVLRRGALWRDVDGDAVLLRLPVGPWTFDFAFTAGDAPCVVAGHPDTLFRDAVPVTLADLPAADRVRLERATGERATPPLAPLPDFARHPGRR